MKVCIRKECQHNRQPQPLSNFGKNSSKPDGLSIYCRDCRSRLARTDRRREQNRAHYLRNRLSGYELQEMEKIEEHNRNLHPANRWKSAMHAYRSIKRLSLLALSNEMGVSYSTAHKWENNGLPPEQIGGFKARIYFGRHLEHTIANLKHNGDMYSVVRLVALCLRDNIPVSQSILRACGVRVRNNGLVETPDGIQADGRVYAKEMKK